MIASRATELLAQGRVMAARPLVAALRPAGANATLAAEIEARLLQAQGDLPSALAKLDAALALSSTSVPLRGLRAQFRLLQGDDVGAAQDAAEAVIGDRHSAAPKIILGRALLRLGLTAEALACLGEALALTPTDICLRFDLIEALEALDDFDAVEALVDEGIALAPGHPGLRNLAILRRVRSKEYRSAIALAAQAKEAGALDAAGFGLLGHALSCLGEQEAAADAYVDALHLVPTDPYVRHLAAAAGRVDAGDLAPPEYVRVIFNSYAEHFDQHLLHLGYRIPGLVRASLAGAPRPGAVLDLGCGTGLLAVAAKAQTTGPWIGVDIASRMLDGAREKQLYAELHEADLIPYLTREERRFSLILAGDVLCYFGTLVPVFAAVAPRLEPGGRFIVTAERSGEPTPFRLGRMGRFEHSADHVRIAADVAGLRVVSLAEEALRREGDRPVSGYLVVLERPA